VLDGAGVSEGPSTFKGTLKQAVADVTKAPEKLSGPHCGLASRLACFPLVSVYQVISKIEKKKKGSYLLSG
jgi:hypothetical protein